MDLDSFLCACPVHGPSCLEQAHRKKDRVHHEPPAQWQSSDAQSLIMTLAFLGAEEAKNLWSANAEEGKKTWVGAALQRLVRIMTFFINQLILFSLLSPSHPVAAADYICWKLTTGYTHFKI